MQPGRRLLEQAYAKLAISLPRRAGQVQSRTGPVPGWASKIQYGRFEVRADAWPYGLPGADVRGRAFACSGSRV